MPLNIVIRFKMQIKGFFLRAIDDLLDPLSSKYFFLLSPATFSFKIVTVVCNIIRGERNDF